MITVLKYGGYNLHDHTQGRVVSSVDILSSSEVLLSFLENEFADGATLTSKRFARREIPIEILIYNDGDCTQQNLRDKVEYMKRVLYSMEEVEIEIGWGDSNIFFTGTAESFEQKYFHDEGFAVVTFVLNCEPFYRDVSGSEYNYNTITSDVYSFQIEGLGHVSPDIIYTVTVNIACTLTAILIENLDLGQKIGVTPMGGFSNNDIINLSGGEVKLNDQPVDYYGLPPEANVGLNNMKISFLGCGMMEDQSQGEEGAKVWQSIYAQNFMAHSFVPNFNVVYPRFDFKVKRHGYPYQQGENMLTTTANWNTGFGGNQRECQTFGVLVSQVWYGANIYIKKKVGKTYGLIGMYLKEGGRDGPTIWYKTISASSVTTSGQWVAFFSPTDPEVLTPGIEYAIYMSSGTSSAGAYAWNVNTGNPYPRGNRSKKIGSSWTTYAGQDLAFWVMVMATLLVRIEDDSLIVPGTPSGNLVNAPSEEYQVELNANNFPIEGQEYDVSAEYSTAITALALLTTYHMVMRQQITVGGDANNHYLWAEASGGSHPGQANRSVDAGASWSSIGLADMIFKAYYDTGPGAFDVDLKVNLQDKYV